MGLSGETGFGLIQSTIGGFLGNSIKSPFWLAIMITVIIILITIFIYPAKKSASISKLLKLMIYIFVTSLILIFLHDSAIREVWQNEHEDKKAREILGGMSDFIANGSKPVIPATFGGEDRSIADPRIGGSDNLIAQ